MAAGTEQPQWDARLWKNYNPKETYHDKRFWNWGPHGPKLRELVLWRRQITLEELEAH
jgi:hypothetical protein